MESFKAQLMLLLVGIIVTCSGITPNRQTKANKIMVHLKLNEKYEPFVGTEINFPAAQSKISLIGKAPGNVLVAAERLTNPEFGYRIKVDSDGDGNLDNETSYTILPNVPLIVRVTRKWLNGKQQQLPYVIKYSRFVDKMNDIRESFLWGAHYRAEGTLTIKDCKAILAVLDLNGDGVFDHKDSSMGTNIGLDRNGDGFIWGSDEWLKSRQIIDSCRTSLLADDIAADGSSITLIETDLRVPKIGDVLPAFSLTTDEGRVILSDKMRGRIFLLDFWASWCQPCIEKLVYLKQLEREFPGEFEIIAINVDEQPYLQNARQIISKNGLKWPLIMNGLGEADPIWRILGGMNNNQMSIPLYILVDDKGILCYAGNGGEKLSELRTKIQNIKSSSR